MKLERYEFYLSSYHKALCVSTLSKLEFHIMSVLEWRNDALIKNLISDICIPKYCHDSWCPLLPCYQYALCCNPSPLSWQCLSLHCCYYDYCCSQYSLYLQMPRQACSKKVFSSSNYFWCKRDSGQNIWFDDSCLVFKVIFLHISYHSNPSINWQYNILILGGGETHKIAPRKPKKTYKNLKFWQFGLCLFIRQELVSKPSMWVFQ